MSFKHSILWRIFVYYTTLITVAVSLLITGFYFYEQSEREKITELKIQQQSFMFLGFLHTKANPLRRRQAANAGGDRLSSQQSEGAQQPREPRNPQRSNPLSRNNFEFLVSQPSFAKKKKDFLLEDGFLMFLNPKKGEVYKTENFPSELLSVTELVDMPTLKVGENLMGSNAFWTINKSDTHYYSVHNLPGSMVMVLGKPVAAVQAELNGILANAILIGLSIILISSGLGYCIIFYSLKPIKRISETAERISNGDISERISGEDLKSELGQLATVLNRTFGRLGDALGRQIQFTSDASHELRTPVAAILADCQFSLKRARSSERYLETIEICHESAQHMRSLIEDLRDLANFDEKNQRPVTQTINIKELLTNVTNVVSPLAEEKGLSFKAELESASIEVDPMRMRQAILNLLGNAVRYTETGGQVTLNCFKQADSIVIEVSDTGIGIAKEKLDHIFDRFYRADEARSSDSGGIGLGLSISKAIVEANSGKISVDSELGVGSCFRIRLDLKN